MPLIPHIFYNDEFVIDFKEKNKFFNSFLAKQCSVIKNNSKILSNFPYTTEKRLETVKLSSGDIGKIIQALFTNKAHGHDKINIRML